jgi:hypothetical protein
VGLDEGQSLQKKMYTQTNSSPVLDFAASIKKNEDQLRRTTLHLRTRVSNFIEVEGGISENLF